MNTQFTNILGRYYRFLGCLRVPRIFEPNTDEVTGENCITRSFILSLFAIYNLNVQAKGTRWEGHVARMGITGYHSGFVVENLGDQWNNLYVGEMIISSWIFEK
jgi:hypothetical protein